MAHLTSIMDEEGWQTNMIPLDRHATYMVVWEFRVVHGLAFDLSPSGARISRAHKENGMEGSCFHVASLASGLKFLFSRFILEILNEYRIASSQLTLNS